MVMKKIYKSSKNLLTNKRKKLVSLALFLALMFGRARSTHSRYGINLSNQPGHERVIPYRDLYSYSLKDSNQQVILAKYEGSSPAPTIGKGSGPSVPSHFPTSYSGSRPSRPVGVNPYRPVPKLVNQGLGAGNPGGAGGGGGAEFDDHDQCPVPKGQESKEASKKFDYDSPSNNLKNKEQSAEQCQLEEFKKDKKYGEFEYKLDKNGNPIFRVKTKKGFEVLLTYDQSLEKYYHENVYNLETPKDFDSQKALSLKYKDRIEYLKKTVPRDKVIEFQIANAKSLSTEKFIPVPGGFIGAQKEPGTLHINTETGQIHFVDDRTNIWRTTVIKTPDGLRKLAENNFHLFPNAGK